VKKTVSIRRGFSLTELLVVVAVILILVALVIVGVQSSYSHAMQLQCQHHLEQISHALNMYSATNHGMLPEAMSLRSGLLWYETLAMTYLDTPTVLGCPSAGEPPEIGTREERETTGDRETVEGYRKALFWLKDIQEKTGPKKGQFPMVGAALSRKHDNVNTAIALMAFLGFGANDRYPPEFAECVRSAVEYLSGPAQWKEGSGAPEADIGRFSGQLNHYAEDTHIIGSQGLPIMALAAAYRTIEDSELRAKARQAAELGLQWLAGQTPYHGGYAYNGPVPADGTARMSTSSWVYQAVGAARLAGFSVPSSMDAPMQHLLDQNAASDGRMTKRWDPTGAGTGGGWQDWTDFALLMRLALGESPGSSVVTSQMNHVTGLSGGVPKHMSGFSNGSARFKYYQITRGLRLAGGSKWDEWLNPSTTYTIDGQLWQGYAYYVLKYLQDDGEDDEGNPMAYWSNLGLVSYGNYQKETWITTFSLMMLSDALGENWLDEDFMPRGDGRCSYGYNLRVTETRGRPAADTVLVMDYASWLISRSQADPTKDDDDSMIALRHGGRANALMGDGRVRALSIEDILEGMWTPQPGD